MKGGCDARLFLRAEVLVFHADYLPSRTPGFSLPGKTTVLPLMNTNAYTNSHEYPQLYAFSAATLNLEPDTIPSSNTQILYLPKPD